jgi:hypothetical protein
MLFGQGLREEPLVRVDPLVGDRAVLAGVVSSPAMNACATLDSFIGSLASWNALRSPSNSDRWVCMPLPGWSVNGLGMKVARTLCESATSFTT